MSFRRCLHLLLLWLHWQLAGAALASEPAAATAAKKQPLNVLFIAVDDLNHWVGYTGRNPQTQTPNIDRISQAGTSFTHAYCSAPACNPARAALMSGIRPSTSGCYLNSDPWKQHIPEGLGLSAQFQKAGYSVAGAGKIYHSCSRYDSEWDDYFVSDEQTGKKQKRSGGNSAKKGGAGVHKLEGFIQPVAHDLADADLSDWQHVDYCIEQLKKQPRDKPFFLACGLHKPHLPWVVPRKYYEQFPLESIKLPPHLEDDLADVPAAGVKMAAPRKDHQKILAANRWRDAVQSYLAAIAYTDVNVGRLLDALEASPYRDNTIICFWGDHGWHLGEKEHWRKFTLWEEGARAPLIWVVPGVTKPGTICDRQVEQLSIYPTLCELASIPVPKHVEGKSIIKLLADPQSDWNSPAITTWGFQNHAVRDNHSAYIRYADGSEELYDRDHDPYEWKNLAQADEARERKQQLVAQLPTVNKPASPGTDPDNLANRKSKDSSSSAKSTSKSSKSGAAGR